MKKSFSQDFSFLLGGAGSVRGPRHPDHRGGARARRVGRLGRAASHCLRQGGADCMNRAARPKLGVTSRKCATRYMSGPTCWTTKARMSPGRELPRWAESLGKGVEPPRRDFWQRVTPSPFRRQVHGRGQRAPLYAGGVSCRPADLLDRAAFPGSAFLSELFRRAWSVICWRDI